jgi:hypothetical protein
MPPTNFDNKLSKYFISNNEQMFINIVGLKIIVRINGILANIDCHFAQLRACTSFEVCNFLNFSGDQAFARAGEDQRTVALVIQPRFQRLKNSICEINKQSK